MKKKAIRLLEENVEYFLGHWNGEGFLKMTKSKNHKGDN